jgi:hypothetical protein
MKLDSINRTTSLVLKCCASSIQCAGNEAELDAQLEVTKGEIDEIGSDSLKYIGTCSMKANKGEESVSDCNAK